MDQSGLVAEDLSNAWHFGTIVRYLSPLWPELPYCRHTKTETLPAFTTMNIYLYLDA